MMQTKRNRHAILILLFLFASGAADAEDRKTTTMNVLFIGNSYTARHQLADVVEKLAESADPTLDFKTSQVIYGGRTLKDHWQFGTQHVVNQHQVTSEEVAATIESLEKAIALDPKNRYAPGGLKRMRALLSQIKEGTVERVKWDLVVLQSYRDDLDGDDSLYMKYVPGYVELAKAQGAEVLLYETTPTTQNQSPVQAPIDLKPVIEKTEAIARLARRNDVKVAPMSFVASKCQTNHPEFTLRFENDAHLNQTMAYLTACTIYSVIFERSALGIEVNSITDIRYWKNDRSTGKDRDGKPIKKVFSEEEKKALQRTAWTALQEFKDRFK